MQVQVLLGAPFDSTSSRRWRDEVSLMASHQPVECPEQVSDTPWRVANASKGLALNQLLNQLDLAGVIRRVAGDADHQVEALGLAKR